MKFSIICVLVTLNFCAIVVSVPLVCEFKFFGQRGYGCSTRYLKIVSKDNRSISEVFGDHLHGKTNEDVLNFELLTGVNYFPHNLGQNFINLEYINVNRASIAVLNAEDFEQFSPKLKSLTVQSSSIEVLEAGLFDNVPNLEIISLTNNKIKHVDDGVFTSLKKLKILWFYSNPCFVYQSISPTNVTIMSISIDIEKKCKDISRINQKDLGKVHKELDEINARLSKLENEISQH